jgi:coenzyme F420-reducing hydrogenase delta subunit
MTPETAITLADSDVAAAAPATASAPLTTSAGAAWEPEIIAFCCNYCAYAAADLAGSKRMQYSPTVRIIHTPCTGKIEMEHILDAFLKGIDGILVAGCLEGGCHFLEGNLRARKRTDRIREMLEEIGVGSDRLKMVNLSAAMAPTFVASVEEMVSTVRALGPSPLKESRPVESEGYEK